MKRLLILTLLTLAACGTGNKKPMETPKDQLVKRLFTLAENGQIAYGHQDDLAYGHAWRVEDYQNDRLERSDVKEVCGQYPAMMGYELGGIELDADESLDGVPFGLIRNAALTHIGRGGMVTFSWHPRNPVTGGDAWDISSDQAVKAILPGGEKNAEFRVWLERVADFFESLGSDTSVIFRPWHEDNGNWFWWCQNVCTNEDYRELYRMTWLYFVKERRLTNLIWCYSPNGPFTAESYLARYPGDEFVDMMAADFYEFIGPEGLEESGARYAGVIKDMLTKLTALGTEHHKLIALSETGLEGIPDPHWWNDVLYPAIQGYPISYVLTWRNAWDRSGHFYGPWKGYAGEEDFKAFAAQESIVML